MAALDLQLMALGCFACGACFGAWLFAQLRARVVGTFLGERLSLGAGRPAHVKE